MTPDEREKFRWQFAGQAMQALIISNSFLSDEGPYRRALIHADCLITELEKTAPVKCEHDFRAVKYNDHGLTRCTKCGVLK